MSAEHDTVNIRTVNTQDTVAGEPSQGANGGDRLNTVNPPRPKRPKMNNTMAVRREIVGQALLNGMNQEQALLSAGYGKSTAQHATKQIRTNLGIDSYLQDWKEQNARRQLESLTQGNVSGEILRKTRDVIDQIDNPAQKAKLMIDYAKLTTGRSQDLLDRAGISKISKSMRITSKVDLGSLEAVQARIEELKAKLANSRCGTGQNGKLTHIDKDSTPVQTVDFSVSGIPGNPTTQGDTPCVPMCKDEAQGANPEIRGGGVRCEDTVPAHIVEPIEDIEGPYVNGEYEA